MNEFLYQIGTVFIAAGIIFAFMMKIQKRKEIEAEKKFRRDLKCRGINPDLE